MNDAHDRFRSWLTDGGRADLPRDVALHASTCDGCLLLATGLDALLSVDPGAAEVPPAIPRAARPARSPIIGTTIARSAAGVAAVGLVTLAVVIGVGSVIRPDGGGLADLDASVEPTPAEGVLGGVGGGIRSAPEATPTSTSTPSASPTERMTSSPVSETTTPGDVTPGPVTPPFATAVPTAIAASPPPAPATPAPTPAPSTSPPTPTPSPTPSPTLTPLPSPSPSPTPTPDPTPDESCDPLLEPGCDLLPSP
jgi:hypothetical protein